MLTAASVRSRSFGGPSPSIGLIGAENRIGARGLGDGDPGET